MSTEKDLRGVRSVGDASSFFRTWAQLPDQPVSRSHPQVTVVPGAVPAAPPTWMTASAPFARDDVGVSALPATNVGDDDPAARLIRRALDGDRTAFGELIDRHERAALAVAYATTRQDALAADAVQEACLKAWRKRDSLDDPRRFAGWLLHIVRRCAIDQVRRSKSAKPLSQVSECEEPDKTRDAAGRMECRETDERVRRTLDELDEESRLAVVMRYYDEASAKQIAEVLGCSSAAVDMRLKRARDKLRSLLCDLDVDAPGRTAVSSLPTL